jgi:gliding motility-associated-like protein
VAKNKYGCNYAMEDEIRVGVASAAVDKVFAYPNVFRPTQPEGTISIGEGQSKENTVFLPINTLIPDEIRSYKMSIYDKKGELIFVSNDIDTGWDGTYRGKLLSQDVYIWQVEAVLVNNAKINQAGDVLLLR